MADISQEITAFQNAVYGEEVRGSMVSLANKLNDLVSSSDLGKILAQQVYFASPDCRFYTKTRIFDGDSNASLLIRWTGNIAHWNIDDHGYIYPKDSPRNVSVINMTYYVGTHYRYEDEDGLIWVRIPDANVLVYDGVDKTFAIVSNSIVDGIRYIPMIGNNNGNIVHGMYSSLILTDNNIRLSAVDADGYVTTAKLADGAVTDEKLAQSGGVLEKVDGLKSAVSNVIIDNPNLIDPSKREAGYLSDGGYVHDDNRYSTTDFMKVTANHYIKKILNPTNIGTSARLIFGYDETKTYRDMISGESLGEGWYTYNIPSGIAYIRLSSGTNTLQGTYFGLGSTIIDPIPGYGKYITENFHIDYSQVDNTPTIPSQSQIDKNTIDISRIATISTNLIDPSKREAGYLTSTGAVTPSVYYSTTDFIRVVTGHYIKKILNPTNIGTSARLIFGYDETKTYRDMISGESLGEGWYTYNIPSGIAYIRLSSGTNTLQGTYFGLGSTIIDPIPGYGFVINPDGRIDYSQINNAPISTQYDYKSSLTGKVWYALGDSATHGDGAITLDNGIYAGQLGVYPFYIGNRTGMIVHNLAVNGAVIATIPDQPSRYQWSVDGHYNSVGNDADYITMWIGANDMWQEVPIGTIDSNDPTTFYGAYNKVLTYYVNNYPKAKLGIVASFWCTEQYAKAVIAIGAKYGIPVLNLYNDPNVPVTVGSKRPDVSTEVKTIRNNQWIVGNGNTHPSSEYHEIESYFIEEWLKTL